MSQLVEVSNLDRRYEGYRLRDDTQEARVLVSLAERGIEHPLEGVDTSAGRLLLNGFKRLRSAQKLGLDSVPYVSLGEEEAMGILSLMRASTDKALNVLEEARFIGELLTVHGLSVPEIAEKLSRSTGWVSMRKNLLAELSPTLAEILFRGAFPVYGYMYTLRPFRRMKGVSAEQLERFVKAVAGPRRSVRDIELLAQGYFRGPAALREAIEAGKVNWSLEQLKCVPEDREGCNEFERVLLGDMDSLQKSLQRVLLKCQDRRLQSRAFFAQANLLAGGLLSQLEPFREGMRAFYDRSGNAQGHLSDVSGRDASAADQPAVPPQPSHGGGDHPPARRAAASGAERQDPCGRGIAAAAVPGMRRLAATSPREAGGGGGSSAQLPDVDASGPRAGRGAAAHDALPARAR
jgi:hypothetical protein